MSNYITEDEYDHLSDFAARNYEYCQTCKKYHRRGTTCPCKMILINNETRARR